jgi:hypothetical protein
MDDGSGCMEMASAAFAGGSAAPPVAMSPPQSFYNYHLKVLKNTLFQIAILNTPLFWIATNDH